MPYSCQFEEVRGNDPSGGDWGNIENLGTAEMLANEKTGCYLKRNERFVERPHSVV